jgi:2-methylaconitate cis-trans-isomerase PrpF
LTNRHIAVATTAAIMRSRAASHASVASTVSEVDQSVNDRVLLYPKGNITISLDIPRSKCMFVVVKVRRTAIVLYLFPRTDIGMIIANDCMR